MSFKLSSDQQAFRDALRDFLSEKVTSEYRRLRGAGAAECDPELWRGLSELGLFAFFADQEESGAAELAIVAAEAGRAVAPESITDALAAGPFLFGHILSAEQRALVQEHFGADFAAGVSTGEVRVGLALGRSSITAFAERGRPPFVRIDGVCRFVSAPSDIDALLIKHDADYYLADLRTGKEQHVVATSTPLIDSTTKTGVVELQNVGALKAALPPHFESIVRLLKAAEMGGAAARAVEMTVDYVKTRKQFGAPVGGFQAVQHRLADMYVQTEALRSLTLFAAWAADSSPDQAGLAAAAACRFACDTAAEVIEGAIQLHGGIGFTWEYDLHFYLRRVKALEALWRPGEEDHRALIEAARAG